MNKTSRAALYARVSSDDQNPEAQLDDLRRVAEQRGWHIMGEYVDHGISGIKETRPALNAMMKDVSKGLVDIIAVWKFDRFGRSARHLITTLDDLRARNIDFVSISHDIDTTTPSGRLSFQIVAAFAEFEYEQARERTKAGVAAARKRGARLGRPPCSFDIETALAMKAAGQSMRQISRTLGVSCATVLRRFTEERSKP